MGCHLCCAHSPVVPFMEKNRYAKRCPLTELSMQGVCDLINDGLISNIVWMSGAGISCSAGIPDFRTPGTGLYSKLARYRLPTPESMFDLAYFRTHPEPFFDLARTLYPGTHRPTKTHFFLKLLQQRGLLLRTYTQNIDMLERMAGIPSSHIVEAHGTWATAHCIECGEMEDANWVKTEICKHRKKPYCRYCEGLLKPDIVFFGEPTPVKMERLAREDFARCDLLIVAGTSLQVQPFASMIGRVEGYVPRLLFNRDPVGLRGDFADGNGFLFGNKHNYRDVCVLGDCDNIVAKFAKLLKLSKPLRELEERWRSPDVGQLYSP